MTTVRSPLLISTCSTARRPGSFDIDPRELAVRITRRTKVVVAVDQFGLPADYPAIEAVIGRRTGVFLVEDAACSLGSTLDGRPCGAFGEAAVMSCKKP